MLEEDEKLYLASGYYLVNRIYYLITDEAVPEGCYYTVPFS